LEVQIQTFETQYRLAPWARVEQRRLDQVRTIVLDNAFAWALDQVGLREEAELCIRNLFVPVRLNLRGSDESIIANWSAALGQEIVRAIGEGSTTNVVVYHSRRQALMDLAVGVARGDLSRAWAWRQMGLWRARDVAGESEAVAELVCALRGTPGLVVPILSALARAGLLQRIASRLTATQWEQLARAALVEAGAEHLLDEGGDARSNRVQRDVQRVLKGSSIIQVLTPSVLPGATRRMRRAVAALGVMDADPSLLRTETAQTLVGLVADVMTDSITSAGPEIVDASTAEFQQADVVTQPAFKSTDLAARDASDATARHAALTARDSSDLARGVDEGPFTVSPPTAPGIAKSAVKPAARRAVGIPETNRKGDIQVELDSVGKRNIEETEPLDLRRRGFTQFGGLLFLLAVIEDLKLPEQIMAHALLGTRPFLWVMHQLALSLAIEEAQDPAALAFAGLPPGAKPPSEEEEAPNPEEARALNTFVAQIVARLRLLLEYEDESETSLLEFVCLRRAEIVADPGWIEVRLSLDEVATEIRRAGLDLNPGYVPWLGVVVVFIYE
jgi:hypothetical protein